MPWISETKTTQVLELRCDECHSVYDSFERKNHDEAVKSAGMQGWELLKGGTCRCHECMAKQEGLA